VSKPIGILFCALILLAGCATTPKQPDEVISSPAAPEANAALNWEDPNTVPRPVHHSPVHQVAPPAPIATVNSPPLVAHQAEPAEPVTTWTALDRWAVQHKIGASKLLSNTPLTIYSVSSSNGVMTLAVGSRAASWNGVELLLGFAPELIGGQMFVYGLDLKKNLEPLLCAPPLSFSTNRVIVIDPGHGGSNTGTKSVLDGRFEKEFTLDWAKRLKPLLESNGWTVFLTRTSDTYLTNSDRVVFADSHKADLFISLHFNSGAPDDRPHGLATFCLTPTGMPSSLTRDYADPWMEHLPNNALDAQNLQLAAKIQSTLLRATDMEDRGVQRARFMEVLRGQKRPAILIEAGYLSNPAEAEKIESSRFRQQLAEAVADALRHSEDGK
jgi:N-acetylmuramoyl-L-alanine amidase